MNLYTQFQTDEHKEVDGTWMPLDATTRIKIARIGNAKYTACVKRLSAPYLKPGVRTTDIPDDVWTGITLEAMAETILVDWDGVVDNNNDPVPYSKAAALTALKDLKDFKLLVAGAADSMETFRMARLAELEKN